MVSRGDTHLTQRHSESTDSAPQGERSTAPTLAVVHIAAVVLNLGDTRKLANEL